MGNGTPASGLGNAGLGQRDRTAFDERPPGKRHEASTVAYLLHIEDEDACVAMIEHMFEVIADVETRFVAGGDHVVNRQTLVTGNFVETEAQCATLRDDGERPKHRLAPDRLR